MYYTLESENYTKSLLKPGLLKSIYENKLPVIIDIACYKEYVLYKNNINIIINQSHIIYSTDYKTFDDFYNYIAKQWFLLFNEIYN